MGKNPDPFLERILRSISIILLGKKSSGWGRLSSKWFILFSLVFILVFILPLAAGEKVLTLEEALNLALKANPEILQAQQEIEAWRGVGLQLSAFPLPEITFSREGLHLSPQEGESEINFGVQYLVEFPGKRALRRELGQHGLEASLWRLETRKRLVLAQVKRAYYLVALAQEKLNYYRSLLDFFRESLRTVQLRYEAGEVPYLDVLRLELEKLPLQNEIIVAEQDLEANWAELALLLGGELKERREVAVELKFQPLPRSLEEMLREAEMRPSLVALDKEIERSQNEVELAKMILRPDVRLSLYYPSLRTSSWGFEVGTAIPLWRSPQKGAVTEALARKKTAEISREFQRQKIVAGITVVFNRLKSLERRLELFDQARLEEVRSLLHLSISLYAQGKVSFLDLLDAYRVNRETYFSFLNTLFEYYLSLAEIDVAGETEWSD